MLKPKVCVWQIIYHKNEICANQIFQRGVKFLLMIIFLKINLTNQCVCVNIIITQLNNVLNIRKISKEKRRKNKKAQIPRHNPYTDWVFARHCDVQNA